MHLTVAKMEETRPVTVRVAVVYEDHHAGILAHNACQQLSRIGAGQYRVNLSSWKAEMLRRPALRKLAADDSSRADIIMVAVGGVGRLPGGIRAWAERWMAFPEACPRALLALLGTPSGDPYAEIPVLGQIQTIAERARARFWALVEQPVDDDWPQFDAEESDLDEILGEALAVVREGPRNAVRSGQSAKALGGEGAFASCRSAGF